MISEQDRNIQSSGNILRPAPENSHWLFGKSTAVSGTPMTLPSNRTRLRLSPIVDWTGSAD